MPKSHEVAPVESPSVESLSTTERLHLASRVVKALARLPENTQRDVLAVVAANSEMGEALYRMLAILRGLSASDRDAVVSSAKALVGPVA